LIAAAGSAKELWYLTRGTGVVALLLLTASIVLGVSTSLGLRHRRWPRFAVTGIHRNLTLLAIVFVVVHVVTTVADGYAPIRLIDAIVPFLSPYRPVWLGLGAVAFDLLIAIVVTSLLRVRIGVRMWRSVHWLAYLSWPVALMHALGTGSDPRTTWLATIGIAALVVVVLAVAARLSLGTGPRRVRRAGFAPLLVLPLLLLGWYRNGPLREGWAHRAGTPSSLLAHATVPVAAVGTPRPPRVFRSPINGTVVQHGDAGGEVTVRLDLHLKDTPRGALRVDLRGFPAANGVSLTASGVSFVPATTGSVYEGRVIGLAGNAVAADVVDAAGDRLRLTLALAIDSGTNTVRGNLSAFVPTGQSGD
jgi:methionine sulfoxide reductase heme-binding subunit